jgi:hypothetical protein
MTDIAVGRISRISFFTDMTRADAPVIPLGFMLEAAWPEKARWLGLVGRTRLTPLELDRINATTWPELQAPFGKLAELFEQGWESPWGEAGTAIQAGWSRSSFSVDTSEHQLSDVCSADTPEAWTSTCDVLCTTLNALRVKLAPTLIAKPVRLRAWQPNKPAPAAVTRPVDFRMRVGAPPEALAA